MNFFEIQSDLHVWQHTNFGDGKPRHAIIGVGEEVGELLHAVLKMSQGIRGDQQSHFVEIRDAVGDIVVYTVDFARRSGLGMLDFPFALMEKIIPAGTTAEYHEYRAFRVGVCAGILAQHFEDYFFLDAMPNVEGRVFLRENICALMRSLAYFCNGLGISFESCIEETVAHVLKRDWTKNKTDGIQS